MGSSLEIANERALFYERSLDCKQFVLVVDYISYFFHGSQTALSSMNGENVVRFSQFLQ